MNWYVVDKDYVNYLIQFDSKVGYVEYGERMKLHIGIILIIEDFNYYVPVSSVKDKHKKMSNSLDFYKLRDRASGYVYAVINLNNMIPVPDTCIIQLKYDRIENFRSFSDNTEKNEYIYLLQKEKSLIDDVQDILQNKAMKLYKKCVDEPNSILATRCYDFKMLEEKCSLYEGEGNSVLSDENVKLFL